MNARLDQLTGPVEVGRHYLVPTVTAEWNGRVAAWPVIGVAHNDAQCLNFPTLHYHIDARFLAKRVDYGWWWRSAFASPMCSHDGDHVTWKSRPYNADGFPAPVWRKRLCRRPGNPILDHMAKLAAANAGWRCHFEMWTGKQARHDGRGWVCPHRAVPLADHAAVDGVITCPLHLLRIDAATGLVLPPLPTDAGVSTDEMGDAP